MMKINGYIGGLVGLFLAMCFTLAQIYASRFPVNGIAEHAAIGILKYILLTYGGFAVGSFVHRTYELSITDPLTQVYNRSFFLTESKKRLALSKSSGRSLSVCIIDVDSFKAYNDTHGHLEGDKLLSSLACAMKEQLDTANASVTRFGGDEFLLLLPGSGPAEASALMMRIGDAGRALGITLSAGVAIYPQNGASVDELLAYADEALYAEKNRKPYAAQMRYKENAYDGLVAT